MTPEEELKACVKSFFEDYLNIRECSDAGYMRAPIAISCARAMKLKPLGILIERMRVLSGARMAHDVAHTTGHCENHKQKGGCQLHNLQCGWPDCDRKPITTPPAQQEPVCDKDPQGCWSVRCQLGKQCKNTPAQRTWVGLSTEDMATCIDEPSWDLILHKAEEILKEKNT